MNLSCQRLFPFSEVCLSHHKQPKLLSDAEELVPLMSKFCCDLGLTETAICKEGGGALFATPNLAAEAN